MQFYYIQIYSHVSVSVAPFIGFLVADCTYSLTSRSHSAGLLHVSLILHSLLLSLPSLIIITMTLLRLCIFYIKHQGKVPSLKTGCVEGGGVAVLRHSSAANVSMLTYSQGQCEHFHLKKTLIIMSAFLILCGSMQTLKILSMAEAHGKVIISASI